MWTEHLIGPARSCTLCLANECIFIVGEGNDNERRIAPMFSINENLDHDVRGMYYEMALWNLSFSKTYFQIKVFKSGIWHNLGTLVNPLGEFSQQLLILGLVLHVICVFCPLDKTRPTGWCNSVVWKVYSCLLTPNCTWNHVLTYTHYRALFIFGEFNKLKHNSK